MTRDLLPTRGDEVGLHVHPRRLNRLPDHCGDVGGVSLPWGSTGVLNRHALQSRPSEGTGGQNGRARKRQVGQRKKRCSPGMPTTDISRTRASI